MVRPTRLLDYWTEGQQLGLLAHALAAEPIGSRKWNACHDALEDCVDSSVDRGVWPSRVPLNVYGVLRGVLANDGPLAAAAARPVSAKLAGHAESMRLVFTGTPELRVFAKRLAYQAVFLKASARELARAAVDCSQHDIANALRGNEILVNQALAKIRSPFWTATRIEGVCELTALVPNTSGGLQLGFAALQLQFAWPLLVLSGTVGISLPLELDLTAGKEGEDRVQIDGLANNLNVTPWRSLLLQGLQNGSQLWRNQHRRFESRWTEIRRLSVVADFRFAHSIVSALPNDFLPFQLDGESAADFFTAAILGRLNGLPLGSGTATTARDPDNGNRLVPPKYIPEKLLAARTFGTVDRVILPVASEKEAIGRAHALDPRYESAVQLAFVGDELTLADTLSVKQWRRYKYFRTPDIRWTLHIGDVAAPLSDAATNVLTRLSHADVAALWVDESPEDVARALWSIRLAPPPSGRAVLSWSFIRVFEREIDEIVWSIVAEAYGVSRDGVAALFKCRTSKDAARELATWLSELAPATGSPQFWAPDLTVLCVAPTFDESRTSARARPLGPSGVLRALNDITSTVAKSMPADCILNYGNARVIIACDHAMQPQAAAARYDRLARHQQLALNRLSVFRAGFDPRQAAAVLDTKTQVGKTRDLLNELQEERLVRHAGGEWHLHPEMRSYASTKVSTSDGAQAHALAAGSMAPYLASDPDTVAFESSMSPQIVAELRYHETQAPPGRESNRLPHTLWSIGPANWGAVHELIKGYHPHVARALRLAGDLIDETGTKSLSFDPLFMACITAATRIFELRGQHLNKPSRLDEPYERFWEWSSAAKRISDADDHTRMVALENLVRVYAEKTGLRDHLTQSAPDIENWPADLATRTRMENYVMVKFADWISEAADAPDPAIYRTAAWGMSFPISALAKGLGIRRNGSFVMEVPTFLQPDEQTRVLVYDCRAAHKRATSKRHTIATGWWGAGLVRLESFLGDVP